jgi:PKD repeat protein
LNQDGDFEDAGEKLFEGAGNDIVDGTIIVPATAATGNTRLRVSMSYSSYPNPCGSFSYGEVEDYTLQVGDGDVGPTASFSFAADGLTVDFTDKSTAPGGSIIAWEWEFGDDDFSEEQHPTHTYAAGGTYGVSLTVTDDSGLTDTALKTVKVSGPVAYCDSSGNSQSYEWIAGVVMGDFSNTSGLSGYSDFTSQVIPVQKGMPQLVALTTGYANTLYLERWRIWADLNQDGDFEDAGEKLFEGSGILIVGGTITVPASAAAGSTRLRVSMSYSGYPDPCGTFSYGEVEDYTLHIQ